MARSKIVSVNSARDESAHQVTDHPDRGRLEAIMDQKLFHQRIKSERSSAYWFAASLWGVTGLVLGGLLGVFLTMMVQTASVPQIRDTLNQGIAIQAAQDTVNSRPSLVDPARNQPPAEQP